MIKKIGSVGQAPERRVYRDFRVERKGFLSVITYRPGYYNIPGIVVAILLLAVGFNGLNLLGAPFWAQPIFNGTVLLVAVVTARAEGRHIRK